MGKHASEHLCQLSTTWTAYQSYALWTKYVNEQTNSVEVIPAFNDSEPGCRDTSS